MQIKVKSLQHTYQLTVNPGSFVSDLRQILPQKECCNRRFRLKGQFLPEEQLLIACVPEDSEAIILLVGPGIGQQVYEVRVEGGLHTAVTCFPSTSLTQFTHLCEQKLQISLRDFQAFYHDVSYPNTALLSDFCVQTSDPILFQRLPKAEPPAAGFQILLMSLTGRVHQIEVTSKTTMVEVRERARDMQGMEWLPDIIVGGKAWGNSADMGDIGAVEGTKFHIVIRHR